MSNTNGVERIDITKNTYVTVGEGKISLQVHKGNIIAAVEGQYKQATIVKGMPCIIFRNLIAAAQIGSYVVEGNCDLAGESVVIEFKTFSAINEMRQALDKIEKELRTRQKSDKV